MPYGRIAIVVLDSTGAIVIELSGLQRELFIKHEWVHLQATKKLARELVLKMATEHTTNPLHEPT